MRQRLDQFLIAFRRTRDVDPKLVPWMAGVAAAVMLVALVVGLVTGAVLAWVLLGLPLALLGAVLVLGRRAQAAQYAHIAGQPGAAFAVLQSMRGQWFVTPAVSVTRKQEFVHRAVGRPGIVLVGEGDSARVKQLLAQERKRHQRAAGGDVPVHTIVVGDRDGQVSLDRLQLHLQKLSRELKKGEVPKLDRRLTALNKANIPMPRGYVPRPGKKQR